VLGVPGRPLIVRSAIRRTSGSIANDPLPPYVAGTLETSCCWFIFGVQHLDLAIVNRVMPSSSPVKRPRSIVVFGV
jgi:hypothetical protein